MDIIQIYIRSGSRIVGELNHIDDSWFLWEFQKWVWQKQGQDGQTQWKKIQKQEVNGYIEHDRG